MSATESKKGYNFKKFIKLKQQGIIIIKEKNGYRREILKNLIVERRWRTLVMATFHQT